MYVLEHVRVSGELDAGCRWVVGVGMLEPRCRECVCVAAALSKSMKTMESMGVGLTRLVFRYGSEAQHAARNFATPRSESGHLRSRFSRLSDTISSAAR